MTQEEVVEIAMHLEAMPRGVDMLVGLSQVQLKLANVTMQLQDMENMKVVHTHVWCNICFFEGNCRDGCPVLPNYVEMGAPIPFPSRQEEWCEICTQWGHAPPRFPTLKKYQMTNHTLFCGFCKYVGHDVNKCHSLQMMQENTHDAFQATGRETWW
jgi:hypothetical protein